MSDIFDSTGRPVNEKVSVKIFNQFVEAIEKEFTQVREAFGSVQQGFMTVQNTIFFVSCRIEFLYEKLKESNPSLEEEYKAYVDSKLAEIGQKQSESKTIEL